MSDKAIVSRYASRLLLGLGIALTTVVIAVFYYSHTYGEVCNFLGNCTSKWDYLKSATPNEVGDTLAGYAGTLAFVWIVVTVCLQAIELREQRIEFAKMATAQEAQVRVLEKQGTIFEDEQLQRNQLRKEKELEQLLKNIQGFLLRQPDDSLLAWFFRFENVKELKSDGVYRRTPNYSGNEGIDEFFRKLSEGIMYRKRGLVTGYADPFGDLWHRDAPEFVHKRLREILDYRDHLSRDQVIRLQTLGIKNLQKELELLLAGESPLLGAKAEEMKSL